MGATANGQNDSQLLGARPLHTPLIALYNSTKLPRGKMDGKSTGASFSLPRLGFRSSGSREISSHEASVALEDASRHSPELQL